LNRSRPSASITAWSALAHSSPRAIPNVDAAEARRLAIHEVRAQHPRLDKERADAERRELLRKTLHPPFDRKLGRRVDSAPAVGDQPADRRDGDDQTRATRTHMGSDRPRDVHGAEQVDLELAPHGGISEGLKEA
tara:strand:- start:108 stop:512 length:405 start_codon:yes stop_codon:yes gene_type:complete